MMISRRSILALCLWNLSLPCHGWTSSTSSTSSSMIHATTRTTTTLQMLSSSEHASYKKVFVAGGSRGVGRHVIEKLLSQDEACHVVALVRTPAAVQDLETLGRVLPVLGDAFEYNDVETAMDGCDAVVTTLGQGTSASSSNDKHKNKRVDKEGNLNVILAAEKLGIDRLVLVTSIGCGCSKEAAPPTVFEVLKDVLAAKEVAEQALMKEGTALNNWTIVRPGGLKSEPATSKAILTEDKMAIGSIHREDVADLVVRALVSPSTGKKVLSAVDPSIVSAANPEGRRVEAFALV